MAKTLRSGQALLIILLVMVVGLTIGLSLSTRSVSDLKTSGQLEDSTRAFSAAEAGIESVLKDSSLGIGSTGTVGNASFTVTNLGSGPSSDTLSLGDVNIGDTYTVWLAAHDASGNLDLTTTYGGGSIDVCWQKADPAAPDQPAMEVSVLYRDAGGVYKVWRGAYDPVSTRGNSFSGVDSQAPCTLTNRKNIILSSLGTTRVALRLRPFYAKAAVSVVPSGGNSLPGQGLSISSVGTAGQTTRKVVVTQSYASLPSIFDYVLFSGKDASK